MSIEITHEKGRFHLAYKSHVVSIVGKIFVVTGLAGILGGPWWAAILFPEAVATPYLICAVFVVIGLGCFAVKHWIIDESMRQIEADKAVWAKKMPDPDAPRAYWTELADTHAYWSSQDSAFQRAYTVFKQPEFSFQHKKTAKIYEKFAQSAIELHALVASNADWYPREQPNVSDYRYALAPDLNPDLAMGGYDKDNVDRYEQLRSEMHRRIEEVESAYRALLKHLRSIGAL